MTPRRSRGNTAPAFLLVAVGLAILPTRGEAQEGEPPPPPADAPRVTHAPIYITPPPGAYLGDETPRPGRRSHSHKTWRVLGFLSIGLMGGGALCVLASGFDYLIFGEPETGEDRAVLYGLAIGGGVLMAVGVTLGIVVLAKRRSPRARVIYAVDERGPLLAIAPTGLRIEF